MRITTFSLAASSAALLLLSACGSDTASTSSAAHGGSTTSSPTASTVTTTSTSTILAEDLTFDKGLSGHVTTADRAREPYSDCHVANTVDYYASSTQTTTSLTLDATIHLLIGGVAKRLTITVGDFTGPGTYQLHDPSKPDQRASGSVSIMPGTDNASGTTPAEWIDYGGTITVSADQRSGAVDAILVPQDQFASANPPKASVTGTWRCG